MINTRPEDTVHGLQNLHATARNEVFLLNS